MNLLQSWQNHMPETTDAFKPIMNQCSMGAGITESHCRSCKHHKAGIPPSTCRDFEDCKFGTLRNDFSTYIIKYPNAPKKKTCEVCGAAFKRKPHTSHADWNSQRTCGNRSCITTLAWKARRK